MSLHILSGPSGSGKTHYLFEYALSEAKKHSDINYYVIVPEQFTLKTQRQLVDMSDCHGILNVDVLSFTRFAYRIFEEVGFSETSGVVMDDMGKNLILRHIASQISEELPYLSDNIRKLGYITEVKSLISEFKQYKISENEIDRMIEYSDENGKTTLSRKLKDVKRLYTEFNLFIKDKYTTTEELLDIAAKEVFKSDKIKKSVVLFDGFTGFTPVQYSLIESLLQISKDIFVTLVTDTRDNVKYNTEHELFYLTYDTDNRLRKIAEKNRIKTEDINLFEPAEKRFDVNKKRLIHLEKNLFREYKVPFNDSGVIEKPTKTVNSEISIISALSPDDEVSKLAENIKNLVVNDGYRYRDIAVVTGDMETYIPLIRRIFPKYDISYFSDKKNPVLLNPFTEYVRAVFAIIVEKWSYEAVFRYLRSPLSGFQTADIDRLENFVLKYGIKGSSSWKASWVEKYSRNLKKGQLEELKSLDNLRENLVKNLLEFQNSITGDYEKSVKKPTKTVNELNMLFYRLLERNDIQFKLIELTEQYSITDDMFKNERQKEFEKVYSFTIKLLDKMSELLGDEKISVEEYSQLLDAGFEEIRIGIIPGVTDYVQIGDLVRSRFSDLKVLFIIGTNDGVIPSRKNSGGLLSDMEKEFLLSKSDELVLSPTARMQAYTGQLYLYMLMTKPSEKLFVSFSRLNSGCESIKPSYIINVLTEMFPDIHVENAEPGNDVFSIRTAFEAGIKELTSGVDSFDMLGYFYSKQEYKDILNKILDSHFTLGPVAMSDSISAAVASVLYNSDLDGSASVLESFAECAYRNFLTYGLSLKERDVFDFKAKDMGNLFHDSLELYSKIVFERKLTWTDIDENVRDSIISEAVSKAMKTGKFDVLYSSFRNKYMVIRMERILRRSVEVLTEHLKAGQFSPLDAEVKFSSIDNLSAFNFELSETERMHLSGKIDRIDTCEDDENLYVKIIDYKSGNKQFDLLEVYKGLSLQLVIYLNAAMEMLEKTTDKKIVPAGILYYHVDDPMVDILASTTGQEIKDKIMSELKMKGLVNSDRDIIRLIDSKFEKKSGIIPVGYKANEEFLKESSVADTESFEIISKYVNKMIQKLGRDILNGCIKAYPVSAKGKDDKRCSYCPYISVCRYESVPDDDSEEFVTKDIDEIVSKMKEEIS